MAELIACTVAIEISFFRILFWGYAEKSFSLKSNLVLLLIMMHAHNNRKVVKISDPKFT
jgi:hypothetical protein